MRMLVMVTNNQMSLRELYTTVLQTHPAGWSTSFMSGMPGEVESIVAGYDGVVYELGAADGAERVTQAAALHRAGAAVITHVEGREAAPRAAELTAAGVHVVANPLNAAHIGEAIDALVAARGAGKRARRVGMRERFRRLFSG